MDVAIVKYNAGNIYSVVNAMKRLGIEPVLTDDAEMLQKADRVLFPGQGQAREARSSTRVLPTRVREYAAAANASAAASVLRPMR